MPAKPLPEWLRVSQAAAILGVSRYTVPSVVSGSPVRVREFPSKQRVYYRPDVEALAQRLETAGPMPKAG
jgi:hypothetical protein